MDEQHYCLRWNNYQHNMTSVFHQLLENEAFVDVTLACDMVSLKAHKVVLSACSTYFQKLLLENPCKHPTIIMPKEIDFADLRFIIEFVYKGEIDVTELELQVLTALRFYATGCYQAAVGGQYDLALSQPSVSRCVRDVTNALNERFLYRWVQFPITAEQRHAARQKFLRAPQPFEGAIGAIDCTYVHLLAPQQHEEAYVNHWGDHTLNVQASLLRTAELLKIRGLFEFPEKHPETTTSRHSPEFSRKVDKASEKTISPSFSALQDNNNRQYKYRRVDTRLGTSESKSNKQSIQIPTGNCEERLQKTTEFPNESTEHEMPIVKYTLNDYKKRLQKQQRGPETEQDIPLNMSSHGIMAGQAIFSTFDTDDFPPEPPAPSAIPVGNVDMDHTATMLTNVPIHRTDLSDATTKYAVEIKKEAEIKFETLRSFEQDSLLEMDSRMSGDHSIGSHEDVGDLHHSNLIDSGYTPPLQTGIHNRLDMNESSDNGDISIKTNGHTDQQAGRGHSGGGPKTWTQEDMDMALDALKNHNMSLTKASATYGIPSTTLWQRAHRLGIDTPKKEGPTKSWTEENLNNALEALRTGTISANKASKAYGIPSSTLYKIARREGIRLAAPFNAAPTTWTPEDLEKALESIRTGQTSVQKASTEFGIPTGTLYGRCKREGIELSRSNPTPWSEDAMGEALEAVRLGHMSINQAAIHYNLPYSSLYGRFKRGIKYDSDNIEIQQENAQPQHMDIHHFGGIEFSNGQPIQYQNQPNS